MSSPFSVGYGNQVKGLLWAPLQLGGRDNCYCLGDGVAQGVPYNETINYLLSFPL
jgi:hypothetical protein